MNTPPILFEDGEALVIDKPAGMPVDRPRSGKPSLTDHLDALKLNFQRPPAPVHRLDTDTSGCLLLARNAKALKRFAAAFAERSPQKIIHRPCRRARGAVPAETIELSLAKVSSSRKRLADDRCEEGQAFHHPLGEAGRDRWLNPAALSSRNRADAPDPYPLRWPGWVRRCWAIRCMAMGGARRAPCCTPSP